MINKRKNTIYGNCQVYSPDGQLMFLCLEKRANWYLTRNLAEVIGTDPLKIKFTFQPGGNGHKDEYYLDEYYLSVKDNACVVCRESNIEYLTKHHIVPIEYRKYFPEEVKSRSSHDVVVICQDHHYEYENNYAQKLKKELEIKYGLLSPVILSDKNKTNKAYNLASILMNSEKCSKIPKERINYMLGEIKSVFGHDDLFEITSQDINRIMYNESLIVGKQLVEKIENIDEFVIMWRQHFIDSMKPKYMPKGWNINNPVRTN